MSEEVQPQEGATDVQPMPDFPPMDMASAFAQMRKDDAARTKQQEAPAEPNLPQEPASPASTGGAADGQPAPAPQPQQVPGYTPGRFDGKAFMTQLQRKAMQDVSDWFEQNDYRLKWSVKDLKQIDEEGNVSYYNPETGRTFASRQDAEDFVYDQNELSRDSFNEMVKRRQQEIFSAAAPSLQVIQYAPIIEKLEPPLQRMLDDYLKPYTLTSEGKIVGYSCDLGAAIKHVQSMATGLSDYARQAKIQAPVKQPELDLKATGGQSKPPASTANTWEEAFRIVKEERKANGK